MKKFLNKIAVKALIAKNEAKAKAMALANNVMDTSGEGYVDTAVKILIAVVIGGLLLAGLIVLFNTVIFPRVTTEVNEMFDAA